MTTVMMTRAPSAAPRCASEVRLLPPAVSETGAVLAMLTRCSRTTLFHRFHGFTDGVAYFGALLRDRPVDRTLLAWYHSRCIGVATLGDGATGIVDLGVLVEDAWQRRGVGTRLASSLLDGARAQGVTHVHAEVLGEDQFILPVLRRIAPLTVSIESGIFSIDIDLSAHPGQDSAIEEGASGDSPRRRRGLALPRDAVWVGFSDAGRAR
jgi:GNAT superfamily N-acetyltransferase